MNRIVFPAIVLLAALALAACGGDDDEASPPASPSATPLATGSPTPAPSPSPADSIDELTYIGADGEIRIASADGSDNRVLVDEPCAAVPSGQVSNLEWSNPGDHLAYLCVTSNAADTSLHVVGGDGSPVLDLAGDAFNSFKWSPNGAKLAIETLTSTTDRAARISVASIPGGEQVTLTEAGLLLNWLGNADVLIGLNVQANDIGVNYNPFLASVATGDTVPFDGFTQTREFWPAPDGETAIVLGDYDESLQGFRMFVYDILANSTAEVTGSAIGYGSDFIPDQLLAFTTDSSAIFWINGNIYDNSPLFTADITAAAPAAQVLGTADIFGVVSPHGLVARLDAPAGVPEALLVSDPSTGEIVTIADGDEVTLGALAWRVTR